ncbi:MAG: cysteine desulfurase NifS [Lentisphaeria bacterium]|nr:cysteine desulfurase NifS [Lentisphaeria bacterium]MDD6338806.1 cysteine desulfurase NifS [Lentisphaeria bacterium]
MIGEERVIYLDNNATTRTAPEAVQAMLPYFSEYYGNASSIHKFGGRLAKVVEEGRAKVAAFLGADPSEIIFTSCGTESDNAAILSSLDVCPKRRKIVISTVEHPAILNLGKDLERRGYTVVRIPVDNFGRLDMERARETIDENTAVVSVMWANNETGNLYPVEELAELAHRAGALFHTDAVQAAGKVPFKLRDMEIDMLSVSGHKFHAPKGIGALYVRRGVRFRPFVVGGHQERGRRAGTENVPYIVGMGVAAELALASFDKENTYVRKLRDDLQARLTAAIPNVRVNGDQEHRLPNTTNLSFEYIEGESILMHMDIYGICASSGSACTTGSLEPSHVMRAMGVPYTAAHGAIRFSFSRYNTQEDVDAVVDVMPGIISKIRAISPYWADFVAKNKQ